MAEIEFIEIPDFDFSGFYYPDFVRNQDYLGHMPNDRGYSPFKIYNEKLMKWNIADSFDIKNYIPVSQYKHAIKTDEYDEELSCLITSNHQIPVGEFTFWDWEDEDKI